MAKWMVEQAKGIEPSLPAWKAGVLAVIRCLHCKFCIFVSHLGYLPRYFYHFRCVFVAKFIFSLGNLEFSRGCYPDRGRYFF